MKKLLMVVLLGASAVAASAQGLQPRRLLGSRLARPRHPVSQTADPEKAQAEQEEQQREAEREEERRQILAMLEELKRTREAKGAADNGSSLRTSVQTSDSIRSRRRRKAVSAAGKGTDSATNNTFAAWRQRLKATEDNMRTEIVNGVTWYYLPFTQDGKTCARITSGSEKYIGELTIPSSLGGYPVTDIGGYRRTGRQAFGESRELKSVTIPSGVTSIGGGAFLGCWGLESVSIPSSVTNIEGAAFCHCRGLKSIMIPPGVTDIGVEMFSGCSGLESVSLPSNMTSIGKYAFYKCSKLKSVTIPFGVTRIEESTFEGCNGLVSVSIPSTVTNIGEKAFARCGGLMSFFVDPDNPAFSSMNGMLCSKDGRFLIVGVNGDVSIPLGVTSIESRAFEGHDGLKSLTIPSSVTCIKGGAFVGCGGLESVTIPTNVMSVGDHAFYDCRGLHSVAILSGETRIRERAFGDCREIRSVETPLSIYARLPYCFTDSLHAIAHITIVDGVERIYEAAFEGCSGLKSVTIPASVKSIDANAFSNCSKLKSVNVIKDGMIKSMSIEDFRNQLNR